MSDRSTQRKEYILDCMYEKFCANSKAYISEVKTALRSHQKGSTSEIYERAIDVLSQDFPVTSSIAGQTKEEEGGDGNELNSLKDRIAQMEKELKEAQKKSSTLASELESVRQEAQKKSLTLETELESVKEEAQKNCSFLETQLNSTIKKNVRLDAKIDDLKHDVKTLASETKELTEVSKQNSANIQGLRKLHVLLKQRNQTAAAAATTPATAATAAATGTAAVTPPPTGATASAISRPLKDVRQRTNFAAKVTKDQSTPDIQDVQLLPGGRILLIDWDNKCMKLFDTQGRHIHSLQCRDSPYRLAVLDSSGASKCITVVVTLPKCAAIDILEVARDDIQVKKTLQMSRKYCAVAAVNKQSLAVAEWAWYNRGIDLIDLDGRLLRQICSSVSTWYMDITEDGELVCSASRNTIARVKVDTGTIVFNNSVPQIKNPWGVAIVSDGSILVTDASNNTLHLVSSQGAWTKQLWSVPSGADQDNKLYSVSMDETMCVCITRSGSVCILDCRY
ncbi:hypothetical protein PoB_004527500 [Plakobranchus ocellatus]|uniref:Uncharacterized protein n=1 Tax=Plakobranchus ocellatus TaxID=259542 RepID=A0AAV4BGV9_9GAST|nr:hypothetical protein PoB_004527500 [Plakobranchus ocellatus]